MESIILKVVPVILILVLGYVLKRLKVLKKEDGDLFLKVVFYVALPSLVVLSLAKVHLQASLVYLPLSAAVIVFAISAIAYFVGKMFALSRSTLGSFITGATIMNIGFVLPFFIAVYGEEGLARVSLFDFGNGLLTFTFVYYVACLYGTNSTAHKTMAKKILVSPPVWASFLGVVLNVTGTPIPFIFTSFLQTVGALTVPLVMLALGVYFNPRLAGAKPVYVAVFLRMIGGLMVGFLVAHLFGLQGLDKLIVMVCGAAPIGYNTLTFSSLENLDKEFAANVISLAILIGVVFCPLLILLLS